MPLNRKAYGIYYLVENKGADVFKKIVGYGVSGGPRINVSNCTAHLKIAKRCPVRKAVVVITLALFSLVPASVTIALASFTHQFSHLRH
jgi:hypothetical protein